LSFNKDKTIVMENLSYPIGRYEAPQMIDETHISTWIEDIANLPAKLRHTVQNLTPEQLDTPYRPGGWTVRQLVHHVADSHANAYIRFKLALTEDNPTIKPYLEAQWAELPDSAMEIELSLRLLESLHARWATILRSMTPPQFERTFFHPQHELSMPLYYALGMYSWHSRHHTAHVERLLERMGW
jgi:uncharacterized damage-inducible protein DinB